MQSSNGKMNQTCLLIASLFATQLAFGAPVGTVTFTTTGATITHADKSVSPAKKSAELLAGDVIDTNAARLQLSLIDGGKVSLQPNTTYKIERYEFPTGKEDGSEYAITELVKGGLRTVSGLIGHKNRDRYQLKTSVATIGIRGTEFTVNFNNNNLLMTTNHGSVDVCNAGGCLNAMTGQTIQVAGLGASPIPSKEPAKAAAAAPAAKVVVASAESTKAVFAAAEITDVKKLAAEQTPVVVVPPAVVVPPPERGLSLVANNTAESGFYDAKSSSGIDGITKIENLTNSVVYQNLAPASDITFYSIANVLTMGTISNASSNTGNVGDLHYIVGVAPDVNKLSTLTGTYTVATASPVMFNLGGGGLAGGTSESIAPVALSPTGPTPVATIAATFHFDFGAGTYNYDMQIPTSIGTYGVSGNETMGALNANGTFGSNAIVDYTPAVGNKTTLGTSDGITGSSIGALQSGNTVMGSFFGKNGEALGLQYGFNASGFGLVNANRATGASTVTGTVFGSVVLQ